LSQGPVKVIKRNLKEISATKGARFRARQVEISDDAPTKDSKKGRGEDLPYSAQELRVEGLGERFPHWKSDATQDRQSRSAPKFSHRVFI
jgi:hypothetical protein